MCDFLLRNGDSEKAFDKQLMSVEMQGFLENKAARNLKNLNCFQAIASTNETPNALRIMVAPTYKSCKHNHTIKKQK